MINEVCNLRCPYCFADEYVNKQPKEISMEDFEKALNFALSSGNDERIGIIGGEPTLHSHFKELMIRLIDDKRVSAVTVFTNGTNIEGFSDELCHPKVALLINCNTPQNMGNKIYEKMKSNIDFLINNKHMKDRITLGINMYKPDFDYSYIIELLHKYHFSTVRTSISVPNETKYIKNPINYFEIMKPRVLEFYEELSAINVAPFFDCNSMPGCVWTQEERDEALAEFPGANKITNIFNTTVSCHPVIDILPDLSIIRCFGLSEYTRRHISDFENINDARNYYIQNFDCFGNNVCHSEKCRNCYEHSVGKCNGGCLCFSIEKIMKMKELFSCNDYLKLT